MLSEHFREGKLHTHFVDQYRDEIMGHMAEVIKRDEDESARLKSTFLPSPKIAAVSAAVNSYIANSTSKKS
jgi:pyruvate carboxylase subunit A